MRRGAAFSSLVVLGLIFGLSACATSRSAIGIDLPKEANKTTGMAVKITTVADARNFATNPDDPTQPSLGDPDDIANAQLTARAIGRKRNTYGQALGDVVLPEGQTVAGVVTGITRRALEEAGYRVVDAGSPDYAKAAAVAVKVDQFWGWSRPGFWSITMSFEGKVALDSDLVTNPAEPVTVHAEIHPQMGTEDNWKEVIQMGATQLIAKMKERLKPAPSTPGVS
jgi:hypothetical protein